MLAFGLSAKSLIHASAEIKKFNSLLCFHVNRCRALQQLAGVARVHTMKVKFKLYGLIDPIWF